MREEAEEKQRPPGVRGCSGQLRAGQRIRHMKKARRVSVNESLTLRVLRLRRFPHIVRGKNLIVTEEYAGEGLASDKIDALIRDIFAL